MLFNSYQFLFLFLPISLIVYNFIASFKYKKAYVISLLISSLLFYGVHNQIYLLLLLASIGLNYYFGNLINKSSKSIGLGILKIGIIFNVLLLFIFKYFNFFAENLSLIGLDMPGINLVLPIGISFYTFQQIGFLVDIYKKESKMCGLIEYSSFVSFFPQLIAGPIVHHADYLRQINSKKFSSYNDKNFSLGTIIFVLGLFKKVIIADTISRNLVDPFYNALSQGNDISLFTSWVGTFSYSMQIYFDFSAYSEMAIGLGLLFGFNLPINFNSPFQSKSLIEYWNRWNITLTNFITNYIYTPIFKNISYSSSNFFNNHIKAIIISMTISGFWHGASWNFILWGLIHGIALAINHYVKAKKIFKNMPTLIKRFLLIIFINISFVIFKLTDISLIKSTLLTLFPINKIFHLNFESLFSTNIFNNTYLFLFFLLALVVLFSPSTLNILGYTSINNKIITNNTLFDRFKLNKFMILSLSLIISLCFLISLIMLHREIEFIYFQF